VPIISTDVATDGTDDTKTVSPKAVKTFVEGKGYVSNTGDETISGNKTFTDNVEVEDTGHILYKVGENGGLRRAYTSAPGDRSVLEFTLTEEPKVFIINSVAPYQFGITDPCLISIVADLDGFHAIYNDSTQHTHLASFTTSYNNGIFTIQDDLGIGFGP
jgi:hypothetical protein